MTTPEHILPESANLSFNVVRIDWPVRSSDMSATEHMKDIFGQRIRHIILAPRNLYALNAALQEESRLITKYQITRIIQSM